MPGSAGAGASPQDQPADDSSDNGCTQDSDLGSVQQRAGAEGETGYEQRHSESDTRQPANAIDVAPGDTFGQGGQTEAYVEPGEKRDAELFAHDEPGDDAQTHRME